MAFKMGLVRWLRSLGPSSGVAAAPGKRASSRA